MTQFKGKKGFEMSINLIVMLVIGLTMMGLIIGFVQGLIGNASSSFDAKLNEAEAKEQDAVAAMSGTFAIGPKTFNIQAGGNKKIFIKLRNTDPNGAIFTVGEFVNSGSDENVLVVGTGISNVGETLDLDLSKISGSDDCSFEINSPSLDIEPEDSQVIPIALIPSSGCTEGAEYFLKVGFKPSGSSFQPGDFKKTETLNFKIVK